MCNIWPKCAKNPPLHDFFLIKFLYRQVILTFFGSYGKIKIMEKISAKIIAIDLDDTLLRDDLTISPHTCSLLCKVANCGIFVVPASGRTTDGICRFAEKIGLFNFPGGRYIVSENGSEVFDVKNKKVLFSTFVDKTIPDILAKAAEYSDFSLTVYQNGEIFTSKDTQWTRLDEKLTGFKFNLVEDFFSFLRKGNFSKIVVGNDREKLLPLEGELQSLFKGKASICFSKPYFLEILPINGGKGNALRYLTENVLGFSSRDVICFGDSFNDKTMLEYAFNSVAMYNASKEIKALSRFSTKFSNNEDGVAKFLEENLVF